MLNNPQLSVLLNDKQITEGLGNQRSAAACMAYWFMGEQIFGWVGLLPALDIKGQVIWNQSDSSAVKQFKYDRIKMDLSLVLVLLYPQLLYIGDMSL